MSTAADTSQETNPVHLRLTRQRPKHQTSRQGASQIGPGHYDNHKFGSIVYDLEKRPVSKKGYSLCARTAARFPPSDKTATPSPQQYQQDQTRSKVIPPGKAPFSSTTQRFSSVPSTAENIPGPGAYAHDVVTNRRVSWPMCFGRPDWSRLPQIEKKSLRGNLSGEFLKQRNRMAYLSLYY